MSTFAAIDFETASHGRDSACAVGVVFVAEGRIVHREQHLIRPPTRDFAFTHIHGLTWNHVSAASSFGEVWRTLHPLLREVQFLAAHNAGFDRSVLNACCLRYSLDRSDTPFVCTVALARRLWNVRPTRLPDVCRHLRIALRHHDAASDAEACARIVMAAERTGWTHSAPR